MKRTIAWVAVILTSVITLMVGAIILTFIGIRGILPNIIIAGCAVAVGCLVYGKMGIFKQPTKRESAKYPILSEAFPFDDLFIDDTIVLSDGCSYRYTGNFGGKYGLDGIQYLELNKSDFQNRVVELRNNRISKWQRK